MRTRFGRSVAVVAAVILVLTALLPAALYAVHRPALCRMGTCCTSCRVLEQSFLLLRMFALAPLLAALLRSLRATGPDRPTGGDALLCALSPVRSKVRMNN